MTIQRLVIIGLGSIGTRHVRCARMLLPEAEITVLRHRLCGGLEGTGIDHCVTTMREALARRPQAAVIAGPATKHLDAALTLANAGVHLLVEKPIAHAPTGVEDLIALARSRAVVLMTGYNLRFLPSLQRFREVLCEGRIGRVLSVHAEIGQHLPSWRPGTDYRDSVSARQDLGGGVLLELSHEIDYLRWIFGDVEWVNAVARRQSALEIDVEDTAMLLLGFVPGPGTAQVIGSLVMDFVRHDGTRRCTVIGERGTLRWDAVAGSVELFTAGAGGWESLHAAPSPRDASYLAEWRHFLECIESKSSPVVSGEDGLAVLRIIEAARESARAERTVRLAGPSAPIGAAMGMA